MGRKRKSVSPIKRSSPAKVAKGDDSQEQEEEEQQLQEESTELAVVEESECDPLATQQNGPEAAPSAASGSEWEDKCRQWVADQEEPESPGPEPLPDHDHEELAQLSSNAIQRPLRYQLKDFTEKQIQHSVMFECEWERCKFECNEDLEYSTHVEKHLQQYLEGAIESEGLVCYWDLCDFRTTSATELESHVHFHSYHNRIKTYGASLDACIDIPKCNNDSRRRNCIEMFKTSFRCEWGRCEEKFNKVVPFFQHVNDHVKDQFPVDRKSTKETIQCEWTNCKQQYIRRSVALEHVRRHSTERTIGCFNCGAIFTSRLKYIEHCRRQVEYHLREIPCPECDKLFATPQLMKDHRAVHNRPHQCPQCPMRWPSRKALTCHIRYRHVNDKQFQCHLCDHRTVTKADLEEHKITHDERKTFRCEEYGCNAAYKCQKSLKKHFDVVHCDFVPSVYACHLCKNTYRSGTNLSKHLQKIHRLKRPPGYNRNLYRPDEDGIYRLQTFDTPSTTTEDPVAAKPSTSSSSKPQKKQQRRRRRPSTPEDDTANLEDDDDDDGDGDDQEDPETFTSYEIAKFQPLSTAKFEVELRPGEEQPTPRSFSQRRKRKSPKTASSSEPGSSPPPSATPPQPGAVILLKEERCDSPGSSPASASHPPTKNIDDFTVMKRYLKVEKLEKPVVISYEETDATGSVIRSETVQTSEISRDRLGRSDL